MAYSASGLRCLVPRVGTSGMAIWSYTSADAHTDVDATDYFASAEDYGMVVNDVIIVVDTATPTCTIHNVASIDSDGNVTITAATLA